jgi:hypothetical protein
MGGVCEALAHDHAPVKQVLAAPGTAETGEPDFHESLSKFIKAAMKYIASGESQRCS